MILDIGPAYRCGVRKERLLRGGHNRLETVRSVGVRNSTNSDRERKAIAESNRRIVVLIARRRWRDARRDRRKYGVATGISYISTGGGAFLEFPRRQENCPRSKSTGAARPALGLGPACVDPGGARKLAMGRGHTLDLAFWR